LEIKLPEIESDFKPHAVKEIFGAELNKRLPVPQEWEGITASCPHCQKEIGLLYDLSYPVSAHPSKIYWWCASCHTEGYVRVRTRLFLELEGFNEKGFLKNGS
jgi:hypothetical protein